MNADTEDKQALLDEKDAIITKLQQGVASLEEQLAQKAHEVRKVKADNSWQPRQFLQREKTFKDLRTKVSKDGAEKEELRQELQKKEAAVSEQLKTGYKNVEELKQTVRRLSHELDDCKRSRADEWQEVHKEGEQYAQAVEEAEAAVVGREEAEARAVVAAKEAEKMKQEVALLLREREETSVEEPFCTLQALLTTQRELRRYEEERLQRLATLEQEYAELKIAADVSRQAVVHVCQFVTEKQKMYECQDGVTSQQFLELQKQLDEKSRALEILGAHREQMVVQLQQEVKRLQSEVESCRSQNTNHPVAEHSIDTINPALNSPLKEELERQTQALQGWKRRAIEMAAKNHASQVKLAQERERAQQLEEDLKDLSVHMLSTNKASIVETTSVKHYESPSPTLNSLKSEFAQAHEVGVELKRRYDRIIGNGM